MNAVGGQLGVDPEDVRITDVSVDDRGAVTVTYQGERFVLQSTMWILPL